MQQFNPEDLLIKMGYAELYEYEDPNTPLVGRFVGFSKNNPAKVRAYNPLTDKVLIGVATVNSITISDIDKEWNKKWLRNEYGDAYIRPRDYAVGSKQYDEFSETIFMGTFKSRTFEGIENPEFDASKNYVNRLSRPEWVRVTLLGKVIVEDNGLCQPGDYCTPYHGTNKDLNGTAVKASDKDKQVFYVLNRVSDKTITILMK